MQIICNRTIIIDMVHTRQLKLIRWVVVTVYQSDYNQFYLSTTYTQ